MKNGISLPGLSSMPGIVLFALIYRLLVDFTFVEIVEPLWLRQGYGRYESNDFSLVIYGLSICACIVVGLYIAILCRRSGIGDIALQFLIIIGVIPFTSMMGFSIFPLGYIVSYLIYWILLIFIYESIKPLIRKRVIGIKTSGPRPFYVLAAVLMISGTLIMASYSGFRIDLNIFNAYDYREMAMSYQYSPIATYLLGLSRLLLPTLLVLSIVYKRHLYSLGILFMGMLNYSFDGGKTLFFLLIVAILVGLMKKIRFQNLMIVMFVALLVFGLLDWFYGSQVFCYLVIRRLLFVPNLINFYFYDVMLIESPNYFSQLSRFIGSSSPSDLDITRRIGASYFGSHNMSANSGMIADALWQLGFLGIIAGPIIISLILTFMNLCTRSFEPYSIFLPAIVIGYYLNNSAILPVLFSHGVFAFGILATFYQSPKAALEKPVRS